MILSQQTRDNLLRDLKAGTFNIGDYPELSGDNNAIDVSVLTSEEIDFLINVNSRIYSIPDYSEFATIKIDRELKIKILNALLTNSLNPEAFQVYAKPNSQNPEIKLDDHETVRLAEILRKIDRKPL